MANVDVAGTATRTRTAAKTTILANGSARSSSSRLVRFFASNYVFNKVDHSSAMQTSERSRIVTRMSKPYR